MNDCVDCRKSINIGAKRCRQCDAIARRGVRTCAVCGIGIWMPNTHSRIFCSLRCRSAFGSAKKAEEALWHEVKTFVVCPECGRFFLPKSTLAQLCSAKCRARRQHRERHGRNRNPRPCEQCQVIFAPEEYGDKRRRFCSLPCSRRYAARTHRPKRRARMRGVPTENIRIEWLLHRDGRACQLCGQLVRTEESVPHPLSPTIDHVIPLSRGGHHTRANVQLAHFACNVKKGANVGHSLSKAVA
jgi:5-methylcytosine-specific restriction endonuclease McrA